ncbi:hypothetical protein IAT38_000891 [Cryptococcus sp. DSM 104549]
MSFRTPVKIGTPIRPSPSSTPAPVAPPATSAPLPPPPVIPTTLLTPSEQRLFLSAIFGLVELTKLWDTFVPLFVADPDPTWTSSLRVQGPGSVLAWTAAEVFALWAVGMLRIPMLSPSWKQLAILAGMSLGVNFACWFLVEPSIMLSYINIVGTAALGGEWYWNWFYALRRYSEPAHLEGVHKIRLLPHSTATLNPLSLTYCLPPDRSDPIWIPVLFNNSDPYEVSYFVRSLDTGHGKAVRKNVHQLKRTPDKPSNKAIRAASDDDEEPLEPETDPLSALVLKTGGQVAQVGMDGSHLPSVKPADSQALVPRNLAPSQNVLFLKVDKPSVVTLQTVTDKRGDRFHITPHREAVIIECPSGGDFIDGPEDPRRLEWRSKQQIPAVLRCVGEEDVAKFQVRGVGPLRVGYELRVNGLVEKTDYIEGIEDERSPVDDDLSLVRRDRVAKTSTVALPVSHYRPGTFLYTLTSVHDALHNSYIPSGTVAQEAYKVIPYASVKFNCPAPVQLLKDQQVSIPIDVVIDGEPEQQLHARYRHTSVEGKVEEKVIEIPRYTKRGQLVVSEPGTYTLVDLEGHCSNGVMEPAKCEVQMVPLPEVQIDVKPLHECAKDVGATASFEFKGTPPFRLEYIEQRKNARAVSYAQVFQSHHGSVVLRPEQEGVYTYTWTKLSDKKYKSVPLSQKTETMTVHPLAIADMVIPAGRPRKRTLHSCSGDVIDMEIDARGIEPLKLTYLRSWATHSENTTVPVPLGRSKISIPVPPEYAAHTGATGRMSIALLEIEDGNNCQRKLTAGTMEVDIKRAKPSARLARSEKVVITEGEVEKVGLRLTGEAPWDVTYTLDGKEKTITVKDPNSPLTLREKGIYRLTKVKDAQCAGEISPSSYTFEIDYKPRPSVDLQELGPISRPGKTFKHAGLCAGQEDQAAVRFTGQPPYELSYRYTADGRTSKHTLKSAQETGILHLASEPGHHRYDLLSIKDGNYPSTDVAITLEQDVFSRPSVSFVKHSGRPICLDSPLVTDAKLKFEGAGPWEATLAVRKPASTAVVEYRIVSASPEWTLSLPEHQLTDIGRHEVTVTRVKDSGGCEWEIGERDELRTMVEVVESARIVSVDERRDLCVGDSLDFLLQGKAPWTIEYEWLGKQYKVSSSASRFSRFAEKKGKFEVTSVALRGDQCKRKVTDMVRTVHALPSARISTGEDDLREGDEPAVFTVKFTGTAPFSFTYTRSEQVGSRSKVVETQTITDISEDYYAISSSLPGDYTVVSVSDKFCRYPPLSRSKE